VSLGQRRDESYFETQRQGEETSSVTYCGFRDGDGNDKVLFPIILKYKISDNDKYMQVEKFYSKQFTDKEEGLMQLKEELKTFDSAVSKHSPNKTARAAILLLHRALRDKVFSVYSLAAQLIRIFFAEFAADR